MEKYLKLKKLDKIGKKKLKNGQGGLNKKKIYKLKKNNT